MQRVLMLAGFFLITSVATAATLVLDAAKGSANPVLAFNLATANDYSPGLQFLDLMKTARPWIGHRSGQWGGMKHNELRSGGFLDEAGWPIRIPPGIDSIGTVFAWRNGNDLAKRKGRYTLIFEGDGVIKFGGGARELSRGPGRITFEYYGNGNWDFRIASTDPHQKGNYIRNIRVVAEKHLSLYEAGAVFNPRWIELIADARVLRFMDWQGTNNSKLASWSDRMQPASPYSGQGHSLEHMVRLANEIGADPWFTIPHLANQEFIRRSAEYVRDHLDVRLVARVEWSNEVWNRLFSQNQWTRDRALEDWGTDDSQDYIVKKAVETSGIWREVFAESPHRLVTVLATHTVNPEQTRRQLEAPRWREAEPHNYVAPATMFDELAIANYFGGNLLKNQSDRNNFLEAIRRSQSDSIAHLNRRLLDPNEPRGINQIRNLMLAQRGVAKSFGLKLVLYEGGQHVHSFISKRSKDGQSSAEERSEMNAALASFVRSPEMAKLYRISWQTWMDVGQGPYMQFADISRPGQYGSWGLYAGLEDLSPRARVVQSLALRNKPWWPGAKSGSQYLHGVIKKGSAASETLRGTPQEDYLLGGPGDDILIGGPGSDGLHGGAGRDTAVFSGPRANYQILKIGTTGIEVSGPDGRDFLTMIEELQFSDGVESLPLR